MTPRPLLAVVAAIAVICAACSATPGASSALPTGTGAGSATCETRPVPAPDSIADWTAPQDPSVFPQIINPAGAIGCGPTRFMFSFLDRDTNVPVAAPDRSVEVAFYDLAADPDSPVATTEARFIWAIEDTTGVYVADADFTSAGVWGAAFTTAVGGGAPETIRVQFDVMLEPTVVSVGDAAPASDTPTLADVDGDVSRISTDEQPVEAFYESSVADALAASEPFVLVFATPKFCATAQCGPTLDGVKPIAAAHPDMTFINVEPYELEMVDGQLQPVLTGDPAALTPVQATRDWRLLAEPWVFVVDGDGIVTASFMLIFGPDELEAAIAAVEGT